MPGFKRRDRILLIIWLWSRCAVLYGKKRREGDDGEMKRMEKAELEKVSRK